MSEAISPNDPEPVASLLLNSMQSETHRQQKERNKAKLRRRRYLKVKETLSAHKEYEKYFEGAAFYSGYFMCVVLKNVERIKSGTYC